MDPAGTETVRSSTAVARPRRTETFSHLIAELITASIRRNELIHHMVN